ncbi:uncharacterized protein BCR38DRAFT_21546 [Pseudomassariella vexata]|uniref:Uncharacterized protein n=1 Tax=Pseudomassariella vexata TaxID=1141098 RepID=A0A1Y2ELT8_9PEZI|nr:uncharacterized protein BCR38DRAFT_21546 [Pseudomassariella vexata]ORY71815.1 hypothetical protein BCR38DRAFT_21546 [Pseudomassariella vexata]
MEFEHGENAKRCARLQQRRGGCTRVSLDLSAGLTDCSQPPSSTIARLSSNRQHAKSLPLRHVHPGCRALPLSNSSRSRCSRSFLSAGGTSTRKAAVHLMGAFARLPRVRAVWSSMYHSRPNEGRLRTLLNTSRNRMYSLSHVGRNFYARARDSLHSAIELLMTAEWLGV